MALYSTAFVITFPDKSEILVARLPKLDPTFYQEHTVKEEETLFDISRFYYRVTFKWFEIAEANNILDPVVLTPGDVLKIPNNV